MFIIYKKIVIVHLPFIVHLRDYVRFVFIKDFIFYCDYIEEQMF